MSWRLANGGVEGQVLRVHSCTTMMHLHFPLLSSPASRSLGDILLEQQQTHQIMSCCCGCFGRLYLLRSLEKHA